MRKKRGEKTKKKMKMTGEDYVGGRAVKQSRRVEPKKTTNKTVGWRRPLRKKRDNEKKRENTSQFPGPQPLTFVDLQLDATFR